MSPVVLVFILVIESLCVCELYQDLQSYRATCMQLRLKVQVYYNLMKGLAFNPNII